MSAELSTEKGAELKEVSLRVRPPSYSMMPDRPHPNATQPDAEDPFEAHHCYSLEGDSANHNKNVSPCDAPNSTSLDYEEGEPVVETETTLGCFWGTVQRLVPHGGPISNSYTFAAITVGAGIISLPSAFNRAGYGLSIIVLLMCSWSTVYSIHLLAIAADKTKLQSWEAMGQRLFRPGFDYFVAFVLWFYTFGTCVSYVISIGDLMTPALQPTDEEGNMIVLENLPSFLQTKAGNRCLTSLVWLVVMLPLSLPKQINSLRYASVLGVSCMMYFVICIVVHSARGFENNRSKHDLALFRSGNNVIVGFSLFLFAFLCQANFFGVYREMRKPSPARVTRHSMGSTLVCFSLYIIAGMMGYADFGDAIEGSVLLSYDVRSDVMIAIAYFGIGIKLCVGFALCMQPARDAVYYMCGIDLMAFPWWKNCLVCGFMSTCALILGLFIPNVNVVLSILGSFCGGFIGCIFPALFVMYAGDWTLKKVGLFHYVSTYVLLLWGLVCLCFGTTAGIYGEI